MEAAIAYWIRLRLPSCRPGFDPKAQQKHNTFSIYVWIVTIQGRK